MKITLPTKLLSEALSRIASIPGANGAAIHTHAVALSADCAGLTLTRFTSEAKISVTIDEGVHVAEEDGSPRVSHAGLAALLGVCNGAEVTLVSDEKTLRLNSGKGKWSLKVIEEESLSEPPEPIGDTEQISVALEDLKELLSFAAPAASKDSAGSIQFCGVNIQRKEDGLYFIATDGKQCRIAIGDYDFDVNCTIPSEGVDAILKAIGSSKGAATLKVGETFASVVSDAIEVSVTLLAAAYPNVVGQFLAQVKNESSIKSKIATSRDELADALESAARVTGGDYKICNLQLEKKFIEVSGSNSADTEGGTSVDGTCTAQALVGVPGAPLAAALRKLKAAADGTVELVLMERAIFIKQPARMAFFALAKPQQH